MSDDKGMFADKGGAQSGPAEPTLGTAANGGSAGDRSDRSADDRPADPSFRTEGGIA